MLKSLLFSDGEHASITMCGLGAILVRVADLNTVLTTVVLIGTAIYTWRKVLRPRKDDDDK